MTTPAEASSRYFFWKVIRNNFSSFQKFVTHVDVIACKLCDKIYRHVENQSQSRILLYNVDTISTISIAWSGKFNVHLLWLKVLKNGPLAEDKQVNGENKGPNKNEDVLIKVSIIWKSVGIDSSEGLCAFCYSVEWVKEFWSFLQEWRKWVCFASQFVL